MAAIRTKDARDTLPRAVSDAFRRGEDEQTSSGEDSGRAMVTLNPLAFRHKRGPLNCAKPRPNRPESPPSGERQIVENTADTTFCPNGSPSNLVSETAPRIERGPRHESRSVPIRPCDGCGAANRRRDSIRNQPVIYCLHHRNRQQPCTPAPTPLTRNHGGF